MGTLPCSDVHAPLTSNGCNVSVQLMTNGNYYGNETESNYGYGVPPYYDYFTYIYRVIYAVGLVGNIFALIVWSRSGLKNSPVTYFQAICVVDSLVLVMHPLEIFYAVHVQGLCQLIHVLFLAVQIFAILLVLGLSVERYIELCHPLAAEMMISHKRTVRTILLLAAISVLSSLCEAYIWHVPSDVGLCILRKDTSQSFMWTYAFLMLAVLFLCPLIMVIVVHFMVAKRIRRRRRNSYAFSDAMVPDKHTMNTSVALVSLYLAVCEIVYACVHVSHYFVGDRDHHGATNGAGAVNGGGTYLNGAGSSVNGGAVNGGGGGVVGELSTNGDGDDEAAGYSPYPGTPVHQSDMPLTGRWHSYYIDSLPLLIVDVIALTSYAIDLTIFTLCSRTFRRHIWALFHRYKRRKSLVLAYRHPMPMTFPSDIDGDLESDSRPLR